MAQKMRSDWLASIPHVSIFPLSIARITATLVQRLMQLVTHVVGQMNSLLATFTSLVPSSIAASSGQTTKHRSASVLCTTLSG